MVFAEALQRYLLFREQQGANPLSYYRLTADWLPALGSTPLTDITTELLEDQLNSWRTHRGWSPASYNNALRVISGFFSWCQHRRWISAHPIKGFIPKLREQNARTRWLQPPEVEAIKKNCPAWLRELIDAAVKTGLRLSELTNLQVGDYHETPDGRAYLLIQTTKNKSQHIFPLEGRLRDLVEFRVGRASSPSQYLFPGPSGGNARSSIKRYLKPAVEKAGITWGGRGDGVSFHTFRHSMASNLLNAGVSTTVIQKLGNWKTPTMVQRYAKVSDRTTWEGAATLDHLFK